MIIMVSNETLKREGARENERGAGRRGLQEINAE